MSQKNINYTIRSVRIVGVVALLLSGFVFLMQGYMNWEGFERFLAFSALNLIVGGFGLFCAKVWNEPKGARTMLALAGAGVSAQYAQLGGMIYSHWQKWKIHTESLSRSDMKDFLKTEVPEIFSKLDVSSFQLLIGVAIIVFVATPLCVMALRVLTQEDYKSYYGLFLINGVLLLLPFRSIYFVIGSVVIAGFAFYQMRKEGLLLINRSMTFEKFLGLSIVAAPIIIHLLRGLFYVEAVYAFLTLIFLAIAVGTYLRREYSKNIIQQFYDCTTQINLRRSQSTALVFSSLSLMALAGHILTNFDFPVLHDAFIILLPVVIFYGEILRRKWFGKNVTVIMTILSLGVFAYIQFFFFGLEGGILLFTLSSVACTYSFVNRDIRSFVIGITMMILALIEITYHGISFSFFTSWINLALMGVITILVASYMEKKVGQIRQLYADLIDHF